MRNEAKRLRDACATVRSSSMPLSDLIPLMQQAADALDKALLERPAIRVKPTVQLTESECRVLNELVAEKYTAFTGIARRFLGDDEVLKLEAKLRNS